jgi:hypothetical protein
MGAWDVGSFDNDTAADWTYGLEKTHELDYVEAAFDRVLAVGTGPVLADAAECAVAAAEVVARLRGNWGDETPYSETADTWVRTHPIRPPRELIDKAVAVLDRIVVAPSELLDLWNETEDAGAWGDAVVELRRRVAS